MHSIFAFFVCVFVFYQHFPFIPTFRTIIHAQKLGSSDKKTKPSLSTEKNKPHTKGEVETDTIYTDQIIIQEDAIGKGIKKNYQNIPLDKGQNKNARKISEVMETQQGIRVNRLGASGTYSTISIRGANSNQSGVYLDGIALNDIYSASSNLENLPIELFESIEIYRSYTPSHLAGSHIGGAIDLVPRRIKKGEKLFFIHSFINSLDGIGLGIGWQLPWGLHYVKREQSQNNYQYYDDNGTVIGNTEDDSIRTRKNEDYELFGYTGIFTFQYKDHVLKALLDFLEKERGIGGTVNSLLFHVRLQEKRGLTRLVHHYTFGEHVFTESSASLHGYKSEIHDPKSELFFGLLEKKYSSFTQAFRLRPYFLFWEERLRFDTHINIQKTQLEQNEEKFAQRKEQEWGLSLSFTERKILRTLIQAKRINTVDIPKGVLKESSFTTTPVRSSQKHSLYSRTLRFVFSPLAFFFSDSKNKITKKTFSKKEQNITKQNFSLELYASYSENQRIPSVAESYGDGGLLLANIDLDIEKGKTQSYGIKGDWVTNKWKFHLSSEYFQTQYDNLIIFLYTSSRTIRASNVGSARIEGVEGELSFFLFNYLHSALRYTYLNTKDTGIIPFYNGKQLPFRPRYAIEYYLEGGTMAIRPFVSLHWLGSLYQDRVNSDIGFVRQRERVDMGINHFLNKKKSSRISFLVKNVFDRFQSDALGYPLPDRTYEIQISMEFMSTKRKDKVVL